MYDYFKGTLVSKNLPNAVVEVGGIGYIALVNSRTVAAMPECGESVKLYTKLIHREDTMLLCGFLHKEERMIFDILTSVSGIGTKVALVLLDEFEATELIGAVIDGDYKFISRAKGVGPKLAQKICLELKDKLTNTQTVAGMILGRVDTPKNVSNTTIEEVQTILVSLGYTQGEYTSAMENALKLLGSDFKDDSQELLRLCLKNLSEG